MEFSWETWTKQPKTTFTGYPTVAQCNVVFYPTANHLNHLDHPIDLSGLLQPMLQVVAKQQPSSDLGFFIATTRTRLAADAVAGYGWIRCQPGEKQFGCDVLITELQARLGLGQDGQGIANVSWEPKGTIIILNWNK